MKNLEKQIHRELVKFKTKFGDPRYYKNGKYLILKSNLSVNEVDAFLSSSLRKIAKEGDKTKIKWDNSKDELYAYFGKCDCGNENVIVGSKYCSECGKIITNHLRSPREKS